MATGALRPVIAQLQNVQSEYETVVDSHQQLLSQLSENEQVQKEFEHAPDDTRIYKRMGPVLMPQETDEAKANVAKRIEFIKTELQRVEQRLKELDGRRDTLQNEVRETKLTHS